MTIDLEPAARGVADLVTALPDERLSAPTPCPAYSVGDLVEHIGGLAIAFTDAASKAGGPTVSQAPAPDAARLGADWRTRIPADLITMAAAWRDPAAWTGMTMAGGVDLPGEIAGLVALDEIFIHGWDLAVASGQRFSYDDTSLRLCTGSCWNRQPPAKRHCGKESSGPSSTCRRTLRCSTASSGWPAGIRVGWRADQPAGTAVDGPVIAVYSETITDRQE